MKFDGKICAKMIQASKSSPFMIERIERAPDRSASVTGDTFSLVKREIECNWINVETIQVQ